jgi:hypothetical protein
MTTLPVWVLVPAAMNYARLLVYVRAYMRARACVCLYVKLFSHATSTKLGSKSLGSCIILILVYNKISSYVANLEQLSRNIRRSISQASFTAVLGYTAYSSFTDTSPLTQFCIPTGSVQDEFCSIRD